MPNRSALAKVVTLTWFFRLIPLLVMLPATLLLSGGPVSGQDGLPAIGDIRDLSTQLSVQRTGDITLAVSVFNHSPITMRNIQVRLTADPPLAFEALTSALGASPDEFDPATNIWTIPELAAGKPVVLYFQPLPGSTAQYVTVQAEIISSEPAEGAANLANNQYAEWVHVEAATTTGQKRKKLVHNAVLYLNVDNSIPEPGQIPVFKVSIVDLDHSTRTFVRFDQADVVVKVELSEGLAFAGAPSPPSGTTFSETASTAGVWRLGRGSWEPGTLSIPVRLTAEADAAPALNRRCLTAQIVDSIPPPSAAFRNDIRSISGRVIRTAQTHTLCLGTEATVISAHPLNPPVAIIYGTCAQDRRSAGACRVDETRETTPLHVIEYDPEDHSSGVAVHRADEVTILVDPEPLANPLTIGGTTYHWSTGHVLSRITNDNRFQGVRLTRVVPGRHFAESRKYKISDVTPKQRPGTMAIVDRYFNNNVLEYYEALNPEKSDKLIDNIGDTWTNTRYFHIVVFSEPGVYKVNLESEYTRKSDSLVISNNAILTYLVGEVAELQVHDAGLHGTLPRGQQAYTLRAENNLERTAELVEVALTGVPQGAKAEVSEDGGEYERGNCGVNGLCSGIWKIGALEGRDYRHLTGRSDGPTLTLLVGGEAKPITATITSEQTKTVTAGGKSYTIEVIDLDDSNSKGVSVAVGTGRGEPDPEAPQSMRVDRIASVALVRWETVEEVSRWPVAFYQVERDNRILDVEVKNPLYLDLQASGNHVYRVRAVNEFGDPGPWSGSIPDAPGDFTVELSDGGNAALLSWTAPASPLPITGYVIDISDSADGDDRTNDATVGANVTTWTHTGLSPGDVKFYRVQARNRDGVGAWTDWQSVSSGPGAPGNLRARANGPSEIVLTWNEASSRDVAIYEYELEYSDTSASEGYEWYFLQTVLHDEGLRYVDNTVPQGTTRYYRVRARTLQGNVGGAWSNVASATTPEAGPAPPLNVAVDFAVGNTENAALLTWEASASGDASYYRIEHSTDGQTWEPESDRHTGTCDVGGTTKFCYTDSGLFSGTEHWYRVAGVNSSGVAGEWSAPVSHVTQGDPTEPPWEPENLRITSVSGRQVSLAWDAPMDDGGSPVTGYEYMVESACVHDPVQICQVIAPTRTGGTSATVTVPNVRGQYQFYVRARNAAGVGWWSQPVSQYIDPRRNWRVTVSPSSLTVPEGGEATYTVRLTSDPGKPVWVALDWYGDSDLGEGHADRGIPSLSEQQFKWLLPSNYASQNPDIYLDPEYTSPYNVGVAITVTAREDGDSENGTADIANTVYYVPCAYLGNPSGCVDDPEDTGITAWVAATERDND